MLKDSDFIKVKIRLNKELCEWIYDEMDEGLKVYPYDDIQTFQMNLTELISQEYSQTEH